MSAGATRGSDTVGRGVQSTVMSTVIAGTVSRPGARYNEIAKQVWDHMVRVRHTLHYQEVFDVVAEVAGGREHKLVEALGERIAQAVLSAFDAEWVCVTVRKPKPIAGVLEHAGIRITRRRESSG